MYYYNARYYDPKLARFISADTIVPNPVNPQALNRYSYVVNNPVKYIDPSGHGFFSKIWKSIKKVVKVVAAVVVAAAAIAIVGPWATNLVWQIGMAGVVGPPGVALGIAGKVIGGMAAGAVAGAASSAVMGGDIGQGALIGAVSGGIFGLTGSIPINNVYIKGMVQIGVGAVAGGIASEISGGKFSDGFKTGSIVAIANIAANKFFEWANKAGKVSLKQKKISLNISPELNIVPKTAASSYQAANTTIFKKGSEWLLKWWLKKQGKKAAGSFFNSLDNPYERDDDGDGKYNFQDPDSEYCRVGCTAEI